MKAACISTVAGVMLLCLMTSCRGHGNEPTPPEPPEKQAMTVQGDSITPWTTTEGSTEVAFEK
mgnify:CR=1 FL=1